MIKLCENGVTNCRIIIPKNYDAVTFYAAEELAMFLYKTAKTAFTIGFDDSEKTECEIVLGATAREPAGSEHCVGVISVQVRSPRTICSARRRPVFSTVASAIDSKMAGASNSTHSTFSTPRPTRSLMPTDR